MPGPVIDEILCNVAPGEVRAALLEDGRLVELLIERGNRSSRLGEVFLGRVRRVIPAMDAAFVDLGLAQDGFLAAGEARRGRGGRDITALVAEGEAVLVQVTKDAVDGKGPALTTNVTLPGRLLVHAPFQEGVAVSHRIDEAGERARLVAAVEAMAEPDEGFILRWSRGF